MADLADYGAHPADGMMNLLNAQATGHFHDIAVIIPAYRPDQTLTAIACELSRDGFRAIIVIDDGSGPAHAEVFEAVSRIAGVHVLRHAVNLGKGAALKTGMNFALCEFAGLAGFVTVDADGQHKPEDVRRVATQLLAHPDSLVLGARRFEGRVPFRSRFGNIVTKRVLQLLVGTNLHDTQTGLRGIPASFAASLLRLASTGYDFELDMLVAARRDSIAIVQEPIETVYELGNKSSHFNPLLDSMRIYFVLVRFCSVSLATALLDNLTFYLFYRHGAGVLGAQVAGRCIAVAFNYLMVRSAVFQARDRHASAFPRYLALVVASGAASYAGITLLLDTTHIPALWAKLGVESLLFFANFAVERDWVFTRSAGEVDTPGIVLPLARPLLWAALLIPVAVEVFGFAQGHLFSEPTWSAEGLRHVERYAAWVFAGACLLGVFARRYFVPVCIAAILVCSVRAVGPVPAGAVVLFVFAATIIGRLLFGEDTEACLAFPAGLAVLSSAIFLTSRVPIHYPLTYLAVLLLPMALGYRQSKRLALEWLDSLRPSRRWSASEYAGLAGCALLLGAYWLLALKPEVSTDGLDMHMAAAANMAMHHAFTFDFRKFVWALMPMGADWCYSAAFILGGEYAARLLNFAMLVLLAVLIFRACREFVSTAVSAFLTALFLSTPMVLLVTGSMFIENFVAALALAGVIALWRFRATASARHLLLSMLLLGSAVAFKLGAVAVAVFAIPFAIVAIALAWPRLGERRRLVIALAALILAVVAAAPYANAWMRAGNPVFPYANQWFRSPYIPSDSRAHFFISEKRYTQPLTWRTPVMMTFQTHLYHEGQDGSFGFQYLLLGPLILVYLISVKSFAGRSAGVIGLGGAILVAASLPNARYLYPLMPFLTVGAGGAFAWLETRYKRAFPVAIGVAAGAACLNVWFLPCADYYHRDFYSTPVLSERGRQAYVMQNGAVREAVEYLNRTDRTGPVAFADGSEIAGLIPPAYTMAWHNYPFWTAAWNCNHPRELIELLNQLHIRVLVVNAAGLKYRPFTYNAIISACGHTNYSAGDYSVVSLRPDCEAVLNAPPGVFRAGNYDDEDLRIVYDGAWTHDHRFPDTWHGTVSYSDGASSDFHFSIVGTGFRYVYTKAFNRGEAEVLVDGALRATLDLYSPVVKWQAGTTFAGLPASAHDIAIRVAHRKNVASKGYFIDVDAIEVF